MIVSTASRKPLMAPRLARSFSVNRRANPPKTLQTSGRIEQIVPFLCPKSRHDEHKVSRGFPASGDPGRLSKVWQSMRMFRLPPVEVEAALQKKSPRASVAQGLS